MGGRNYGISEGTLKLQAFFLKDGGIKRREEDSGRGERPEEQSLVTRKTLLRISCKQWSTSVRFHVQNICNSQFLLVIKFKPG